MNTILRNTILLAAAACIAGTAQVHAQETAPREKPLRVLTSFLPMQAHTMAIAGDRAEVRQLLDKDTGPHDFQLTPGDVRKLADADLLVINGAGMEGWMDNLISRAGNANLIVVNTSAGIDLRESAEPLELGIAEEAGGHDHSHDHSHDGHTHGAHCNHEGENPHLWLDPVFALQQARAVLDALVKADPANAEYYKANAEAYFARLQALDARFRETLSALPNKKLVTFHDAFPYLADRYGLEYVGYIEQFPEEDPSPRQLGALVKLIKENDIGVVFAEKGYSTILFQRIADQTGARVSELDTMEIGLGDAGSYLERMEQNLIALEEAFGKPRS
jgi:zinc transport system substrate-binding protein